MNSTVQCELNVVANQTYHSNDWNIVLCQIREPVGFVIPEFFDMGTLDPAALPEGNQSTNYLAINVTNPHKFSGYPDNYNVSLKRTDSDGEWLILSPEWLDVSYQVGVSLCFSAFSDIASPIHALSSENRTQPSPQNIGADYRFNDIRKQIGQNNSMGADERGILSLQPDDWIIRRIQAEKTLVGYLQPAVAMNSLNYSITTISAVFWPGTDGLVVDPTISMLFQEILTRGGGIAFAIQSVLTTLASIAYYHQVAFYDQPFSTNQTYLALTQIPGGNSRYAAAPAGFLPGYTSVMSLVAGHCILSVLLTIQMRITNSKLFLVLQLSVGISSSVSRYLSLKNIKHANIGATGTSLSTLHNTWQAVAQLQVYPVREYLSEASFIEDKQVERWMKMDGFDKQIVGIRKSNDGEKIEIGHIARYRPLH